MALATRCNGCGTVFRVVQDQLRVSEGWVRCGRCSAVFNAALELFDLDNGAPVQMPASEQAPVSFQASSTWPGSAAEPAASRRPGVPGFGASPGLAPPVRPAAPSFPTAGNEPDDASFDSPTEERAGLPFDDHAAGGSDEPLAEPVAAARPPQMDPTAVVLPPARALLDPISDAAAVTATAIIDFSGAEPDGSGAAIHVDADETMLPPSFVRAAERAAFWRQSSVRAGLLGSIALLTLLLAVQAGAIWRDPLAASVPALRPALEALCGVAGCEISPLRRIERLSVDSSALTRLEGTPLYRLSLVLRSRAETALLAPALDLSLTDSQGRLVLRRVLQAAELGLPRPVIDAGQELPLQLLLSVGDQRVTGYTVELFYP